MAKAQLFASITLAKAATKCDDPLVGRAAGLLLWRSAQSGDSKADEVEFFVVKEAGSDSRGRRVGWNFAGGARDQAETLLANALREFAEETGNKRKSVSQYTVSVEMLKRLEDAMTTCPVLWIPVGKYVLFLVCADAIPDNQALHGLPSAYKRSTLGHEEAFEVAWKSVSDLQTQETVKMLSVLLKDPVFQAMLTNWPLSGTGAIVQKSLPAPSVWMKSSQPDAPGSNLATTLPSPVCRNWAATGSCKFGIACHFANTHVPTPSLCRPDGEYASQDLEGYPSLNPLAAAFTPDLEECPTLNPSAAAFTPSSTQITYRNLSVFSTDAIRSVCKHWLTEGQCPFGPRCRFALTHTAKNCLLAFVRSMNGEQFLAELSTIQREFHSSFTLDPPQMLQLETGTICATLSSTSSTVLDAALNRAAKLMVDVREDLVTDAVGVSPMILELMKDTTGEFHALMTKFQRTIVLLTSDTGDQIAKASNSDIPDRVWSWQTDGGNFREYSTSETLQLNQCIAEKKTSCSLTDTPYVIDFDSMKQTNTKTSSIRLVRCEPAAAIPSNTSSAMPEVAQPGAVPSSVCTHWIQHAQCSFADKCKFVKSHTEDNKALCRFGSACTSQKCRFRHSGSQKHHRAPDLSRDPRQPECKFGLQCTRSDCWFNHSELKADHGSVACVRTTAKTQWFWEDDSGAQIPFSDDVNKKLSSGVPFKLTIDSRVYHLHPKERIQVNSETRRRRRLFEKVAQGTKVKTKSIKVPPSASITFIGRRADVAAAKGALLGAKDRLATTATLPLDLELIHLEDIRGRLSEAKISVEADVASGDSLPSKRPNETFLVLRGSTSAVRDARELVLDIVQKAAHEMQAASAAPLEWEKHEGNLALIRVQPGSAEWLRVEKEMGGMGKIMKLERIQNSWLWRKYCSERANLLRKNTGLSDPINERRLFHGSKGNSPQEIYNGEEGFDLRFSAQGMWGRGIYFAEKASYSDCYCYVPPASNSKLKQMLLATVICGDSVKCEPNDKLTLPPAKRSAAAGVLSFATERYDSVNGITKGCSVFIIYSNLKAYPLYLISYTT